jgi:hypothetical protein
LAVVRWDGVARAHSEPSPEFEWYATGTLSLKEAAEKARTAGLVYRKSGAAIPVSTVHTTLRNRLYPGEFEWNGHVYMGKRQPLVTRALWERVQGVLGANHDPGQRHCIPRFGQNLGTRLEGVGENAGVLGTYSPSTLGWRKTR